MREMKVLDPERLKFSAARIDNALHLRLVDSRYRDDVLQVRVDQANPVDLCTFTPIEHALMDWIRRWVDAGKSTQSDRWQQSLVRDSEIHLDSEKFGGVFAAGLFPGETRDTASATFYRKTYTRSGEYALIYRSHKLDGQFRKLSFPRGSRELQIVQPDQEQEADRRIR